MTNLIAILTVCISTQWVLSSTINPIDTNQNITDEMGRIVGRTLVYPATGYNYTGKVTKNTTALIRWGGKEVPVTLESVQIETINKTEWR